MRAINPVPLGPNQLRRFYRGGARIASFRGIAAADDYAPEDWVASTTTSFGEAEAGLTRLPDGQTLRAAVEADPGAYLGAAHVNRFGAGTELLVKLLDAGERLPVHCHPDDAFAVRHLGCPYGDHGKTEAWIVLPGSAPDAAVYLGFRSEVDEETLRDWTVTQDSAAMLAAMNRFEVAVGDRVLVPAGVPHAIGAGAFVIELQEPADLSVMLEWKPFGVDGRVQVGVDRDVALGCLDRHALDEKRLRRLHLRNAGTPTPGHPVSLLPAEADPFFRAEDVSPRGSAVTLEAGFSVLVACAGTGTLSTGHGDPVPLRTGDTVLLPFGCGEAELAGDVHVVRCRPPEPTAR
jgi:mannose-6-phosphate isomerase